MFGGRGPPTYNVHGQIFHFVGLAETGQGQAPTFLQSYFIEAEEAIGHQIE